MNLKLVLGILLVVATLQILAVIVLGRRLFRPPEPSWLAKVDVCWIGDCENGRGGTKEDLRFLYLTGRLRAQPVSITFKTALTDAEVEAVRYALQDPRNYLRTPDE